ncbi:1146_t:CDS:2, partial [Ambispora leptoticha]
YLRRVGDRIGERVISFNPSVLTNDYIKTAASSDDDIELDGDANAKQPSFAKLLLPKQTVPPPPVFVTSPSKPPT